MGVSNYTPTGISHATSVDFSKRSVNQPVHIVQYDRSLPILAVSLYNNGQLYRLSEDMEVSIRLGKPDRTFVYNKAIGCDSTRTIVYFEITQQMSLFDGEYYPVIEIMDGDKIANSSTIYLVVDRNPVQHDYIESSVEYKELIDYRDEAVKAGKEAKESAKIASDSAKTSVDKAKEAVEASETAVNAANSASESAESILGVEENVTRIGNMVSEKEPIITAAAETASTSATNARQSETNAKASEEAAKLSETNAKDSETNAKASEEAAKLSETNAKDSENESVKYGNLAKSYAVGTDNAIRENDAEDNAKTYCEAAKTSAGNAKQSETNAKTYLDKIIEKVDVTVDAEMSDTSENPVQNKVIKNYVDKHTPEVADMTGATATQNGAHGLVPAPRMGDEKKALLGNGTWEKVVINVDTAMSDTSKNPVQNKVIKKYVDEKQVNIDGVTLTLDEARNVIKLADTLKDKIGSALQPESIVNNQITTVEGFALDARQANPNINGTLAKQVADLNGSLNDAATKNDIKALNPSSSIKAYIASRLGKSGIGWYRFAEITCENSSIARGALCQYMEILIMQAYNSSTGCFHRINIYMKHPDNAKMTAIGQNTNVLKKVRAVRKDNIILLDIYSSQLVNDSYMLLNIPFGINIISAKCVVPHLVPETTDGEVIVSSVDLANNI